MVMSGRSLCLTPSLLCSFPRSLESTSLRSAVSAMVTGLLPCMSISKPPITAMVIDAFSEGVPLIIAFCSTLRLFLAVASVYTLARKESFWPFRLRHPFPLFSNRTVTKRVIFETYTILPLNYLLK